MPAAQLPGDVVQRLELQVLCSPLPVGPQSQQLRILVNCCLVYMPEKMSGCLRSVQLVG